MLKAVDRLYAISRKPVRRIIGLMSGTSLDGLDIALCEIGSHGMATRVRVPHFTTVAYPALVKQEIRKVFAKDQVDLRRLTLLNPWLGRQHAAWILDCLRQWGVAADDIDLVASHGQTVYHCPKILHHLDGFPDATLQIGDGDHIAVGTGIITVSDFRQKHIAAGGEGAPLALYGDYCLFSRAGEDRIMLNMGGIANFTFLSGDLDARSALVTDTGPGNTLIDQCAQRYFGQEYDKDALLARQGTVSEPLLRALKANEFFSVPAPRTTGPELFNLDYIHRAQAASHTEDLAAFDVMATLTRFSAETILDTIRQVVPDGYGQPVVYMSGGGARNPLLTDWIAAGLGIAGLRSTDELGISADAKEAVLFAVLANEAVCGEPIDFGRPGMPAITMGKISFPASL